MTFYVGQKVVCISVGVSPSIARWCGGREANQISVGKIYTIREIDMRAFHLHGCATLRFEEVRGRFQPETTIGPWECGYPATHFRPVVERKTDISIFTEILDRVNGNKPRVREVEHQS